MKAMKETLMIGQVAKAAGVNVQTVRYYERRRLVEPDARLESGYRVYSVEAVRKLRFIKNAQALGFSLEEIRSLLRLRSGGAASCERVRRKAAEHVAGVRERIERLRAMERVLSQLIRTCQKQGRTDDCPILRSLEAAK